MKGISPAAAAAAAPNAHPGVAALPRMTTSVLSPAASSSCSRQQRAGSGSSSHSSSSSSHRHSYHHHPYHRHEATTTRLPRTQQQQQQQEPPLLLLEGDELHVSPQGIARSVYQLVDNDNDDNSAASSCCWTIEERYNLVDSTKTFLVRHNSRCSLLLDIQECDTRMVGTGGTTWEASLAMALYFARHPHQLLHGGRVIELGSGVGLGGLLVHHVVTSSSREQQEQNINNNVEMTLTDGNPAVVQQCRCNIAANARRRYHNNNNNSSGSGIKVQKLDWNDVLRDLQQQHQHQDPTTTAITTNSNTNGNNSKISYPPNNNKYHTVLACDCAYRSRDVPGLTETLKALLLQDDDDDDDDERGHDDHDHHQQTSNTSTSSTTDKNAKLPPSLSFTCTTTNPPHQQQSSTSNKNKIHLFGPYNRATYHEVIDALEKDETLDLHVEWIHLKRYRLAANKNSNSCNSTCTTITTTSSEFDFANKNIMRHDGDGDDDDELKDASQSTSKFLHVTATFREKSQRVTPGARVGSPSSLADID